MSGVIRILLLGICVMLSPSIMLSHGTAQVAEPLVIINGNEFSTDQYNNWWKNWREPGMELPDSMDSFVEWQLLVHEAKTMELYQEPRLRNKLDVFLKSRTLLLYKNEVIDSKLNISIDELRARYDEKYSPRVKMQALYFNEMEKASAIHKALSAGVLSFNDLKERSAIEGSDVYYELKVVRVKNLIEPWQAILKDLELGKIKPPTPFLDGFVIVQIIEEIEFDQEDFDQLKDSIYTEIRKRRQSELTRDLVVQLKNKYQVKVDQDLLATIDTDTDQESFSDRPLIQTNRAPITVGHFVKMFRRERSRKQRNSRMSGSKSSLENDMTLRQWLIESILSQTLTTWAALDRHYEKEPPFKAIYEFYTGHRLIKELETRLFMPLADVTQEEVIAYYNANKELFINADVVSIAFFEGEKEEVKKVWSAIALGEDFLAAVKIHGGREVAVEGKRVTELDPKLNKVLNRLSLQEVSVPFEFNGKSAVVQLLDRIPGETRPLEIASRQIKAHLQKQKLDKIRNAYIAQLKARSEISVNTNVWQGLKMELAQKY